METARIGIAVNGQVFCQRWLTACDDGYLKIAQQFKRHDPASTVEIVSSEGNRVPIHLPPVKE